MSRKPLESNLRRRKMARLFHAARESLRLTLLTGGGPVSISPPDPERVQGPGAIASAWDLFVRWDARQGPASTGRRGDATATRRLFRASCCRHSNTVLVEAGPQARPRIAIGESTLVDFGTYSKWSIYLLVQLMQHHQRIVPAAHIQLLRQRVQRRRCGGKLARAAASPSSRPARSCCPARPTHPAPETRESAAPAAPPPATPPRSPTAHAVPECRSGAPGSPDGRDS